MHAITLLDCLRALNQAAPRGVPQPIRGYAREGAKGALKGLGKGLVGAVVKPAAGLADLVQQVRGKGARDIVGSSFS